MRPESNADAGWGGGGQEMVKVARQKLKWRPVTSRNTVAGGCGDISQSAICVSFEQPDSSLSGTEGKEAMLCVRRYCKSYARKGRTAVSSFEAPRVTPTLRAPTSIKRLLRPPIPPALSNGPTYFTKSSGNKSI